jgi:hypothetical protein
MTTLAGELGRRRLIRPTRDALLVGTGPALLMLSVRLLRGRPGK